MTDEINLFSNSFWKTDWFVVGVSKHWLKCQAPADSLHGQRLAVGVSSGNDLKARAKFQRADKFASLSLAPDLNSFQEDHQPSNILVVSLKFSKSEIILISSSKMLFSMAIVAICSN